MNMTNEKNFWDAETELRLKQIKADLISAETAWKSLTNGCYGSPSFPNYTKLIDSRKAENND